MLQSMTGYGKSVCELPGKTISIEIKSLNSKQLDLNLKLPFQYREKEMEIRNLISQKLQRGKVECSLYLDITREDSKYKINQEIVRNYMDQLSQFATPAEELRTDRLLQIALRLPDVLKTENEELEEKEWSRVIRELNGALTELVSFRQQEGNALEDDIRMRINNILQKLDEIGPYEQERKNSMRDRISSALAELKSENSKDENRFEQEMIYYLEKFDITEEKVRLQNHCKFFIETLGIAEQIGKKLGFISQEMGREINTIGSKASHTIIQQLVVGMKDELEKIKEQLLNVL